jgi:nucleoside-diphosphate-sugar epimerase
MTTAIVTGASGFIGIHLVRELLSRGVEVTAFCRPDSTNNSRLSSDVRKAYAFDELPTADVFYHLAWDCASGAGRANAATQASNTILALGALEAAARLKCGRFIILGTVYEKFAPAIRQKTAFGSSDFYILSKDYAHAMTSRLAYKLEIEYTYVTICHPFGKYVKPEQMLASVTRALRDGVAVDAGPGTEYYDIVAVEDLAYGLRLLGERETPEREYYIGSGTPRLLRDYLTEAREALGVDTPINFGARPHDGLCFEREWFDITPMGRDTGYKPQLSFAEIVRGANEW